MEMPDDKAYLLELAHKWKKGQLSAEELAKFNAWYDDHSDEVLELPEGYADNPFIIRDRMMDNLFFKVHAAGQVKRRPGFWPMIAAAAAIVLAIGAGIFFYTGNTTLKKTYAYTNDIAPGKNGATLTLANGKKIYITDAETGKLAEQAGVSIHKTADGQIIYEIKKGTDEKPEYNVLQTANGQQTQVILPDGSKVFLNAASSIRYPSSFVTFKERKVELDGEAYFEVSKDKIHPFIVSTSLQEVKVLGTHFNINSYKEAPNVKTTLLEGAVSIKTLSGEGAILTPGQQAAVDGKKISVNEVETAYEVAWKNGYFLFNNENLNAIMETLCRWYNIRVKYDDPALKNELFFGKISKYENVSKILKMLERTDIVKFKIEGNSITIFRKK